MSDRRISPAILQEYKAQGVVLLKSLIEEDCIDALRLATERSLSHPGPLAREYPTENGQGRFFTDLFLWLNDSALQEFVKRSSLPAIAAQLLESSKVNLFYDQIFVKESGTSNRSPWHQDLPYWPVNGVQVMSFWIALDSVTMDSGGLEYVSGSHLWKKNYQPFSFAGRNHYTRDPELELIPDIDSMRSELRIATFDMSPGDALAFDARIIHGAGGNRSGHLRRRGYSIRYCGDDVTFAPRKETLPLPSDPGLAWGAALDCSLFPQVWPMPASEHDVGPGIRAG